MTAHTVSTLSSNGTAGVRNCVTSDLRRTHANGKWESGAIFLPASPGPGEEGYVHGCYAQGGALGRKDNKGTYESPE